MMIKQVEIYPICFWFLKSALKTDLSIDYGANIEGQYCQVRLEQAFLIWWYGTRIQFVYFEQAAWENF